MQLWTSLTVGLLARCRSGACREADAKTKQDCSDDCLYVLRRNRLKIHTTCYFHDHCYLLWLWLFLLLLLLLLLSLLSFLVVGCCCSRNRKPLVLSNAESELSAGTGQEV